MSLEVFHFFHYLRVYFLAAGSGSSVSFQLPLPPVKGSLKLYIDDLKVYLLDADATDYITRLKIFGVNTTTTDLLDVGTNHTSTGDKTYAFEAIDCSSYHTITVQIQVTTAADGELEFFPPRLGCYYAT